MNTSEFIAEVHSKLPTYSQQGLIDDITLRNVLRECLTDFGGNIMEQRQVTIPVNNGLARLPQNFWALKAAVKYDSQGYTKEEKTTTRHNQAIRSYLDWTEISDYYNYLEGKPCKEDGDTRYITETLWFDIPDNTYTFYYNNRHILQMVPHVYKVRTEEDCINMTVKSPYTVSIDQKHKNLSLNFNEGFVWVWYRALPSDEKGELEIPHTSKQSLENYCVWKGVIKILENVWFSEDDPNVINKIQYAQNQANEYFYQAKSESISSNVQKGMRAIRDNNRRYINKFERMIGNL